MLHVETLKHYLRTRVHVQNTQKSHISGLNMFGLRKVVGLGQTSVFV